MPGAMGTAQTDFGPQLTGLASAPGAPEGASTQVVHALLFFFLGAFFFVGTTPLTPTRARARARLPPNRSFDPRGYGNSRPPARDFPPDFYQRDADDGAALMDALGVKECVGTCSLRLRA